MLATGQIWVRKQQEREYEVEGIMEKNVLVRRRDVDDSRDNFSHVGKDMKSKAVNINCVAFLCVVERNATSHTRFEVMQSDED